MVILHIYLYKADVLNPLASSVNFIILNSLNLTISSCCQGSFCCAVLHACLLWEHQKEFPDKHDFTITHGKYHSWLLTSSLQ